MTQPKYAPTKLPGGPQRIIDICEDLRARNKDGYLNGAGCKFLAAVKGSPIAVGPGTSCSPFTGCVTGVAFDPKYPKNDLNGEPYEPLFNGGNDPLPFGKFYYEHNNLNDHGVSSLIDFGLGYQVEPKKMRRGDLVEINWVGHGGHLVFCWDVHLNDKDEVDAFLIIGANGPSPGVSIYGCSDKRWLKGQNASKPGNGTYEKAKDKIFADDDDDIIRAGMWLGYPKGPQKVDKKSFRVMPTRFFPSGAEWTVGTLRVGRFNYDGDPPAPVCNAKGGGTATTALPPGHIDAPVTTIKGNDLKKDPEAPKKVQPKPAKQDDKKVLDSQYEVELALQEFFHGGWIDADPGKADNVNDAQSQAAIKAFQKSFKLDVDGIAGKFTKGELRKQLPALRAQHAAQEQLARLFQGGKLKTDPGPPGADAARMRDAVKEFQKANGLNPNGLPDADTQSKLKQVLDGHGASESQHGLSPMVLVLYWLGNTVAAGGSAKLRMHTYDVKRGLELDVFLKDAITGNELNAGVKMAVTGDVSELAVPIPAAFQDGSLVFARVKSSGDKPLEMGCVAPLYVGTPPAAQKVAPGELQKFFTFDGDVGEGSKKRDYTYVAYKVPGKDKAWLIKGRLLMDVDGAPNCYHPQNYKVNTHYWNIDFENYDGALDYLANGGHPAKDGKPANWFGVVTDNGQSTGNPLVQGSNDPFPGFYISSTSLVDKTKNRGDTKRYVDARKIPYMAWPQQVWLEKGPRFKRVSAGATGTIGDIITAVNPKNNKVAHLVFADMGGYNDPHFGEGSPALGKMLDAWGHQEPDILYIVHPHSGAGQGTIPTFDQIQEKGQKLFDEWGGMDQVKRVLPLVSP